MNQTIETALKAGATVYLCTEVSGREYTIISFGDKPENRGKIIRHRWTT